MSSEEILIAGHSHLNAFGIPFETPDGAPSWIKLRDGKPPVLGLSGAWPRDEAFWTALARRAPRRTIVISWRGSQHIADFLFERSPAFDFRAASRPDLELAAHATLVPEAQIRAHFAPGIAALAKQLQRLHQADRRVVLGTPPPKADNDMLRRVLMSEPHFPAVAKKLRLDMETAPLTSPVLRLKLWTVMQDLMAECAQRHGCDFIPAPALGMSGLGFLREDLAKNDVNHANPKYGRMMLNVIERALCHEPSPLARPVRRAVK